MPSPFPGMDPYLEGFLWPDIHHNLATEIRRRLAPRVRPRYVARIGVHLAEDETPEAEIGILYPDVEGLQRSARTSPELSDTGSPNFAPDAPQTSRAPLRLPLLSPVDVRIPSVEIRDAAGNELVTTIEILSPVNKREPGLGKYREKRRRLREAGVHVLELDLLRRGTRPLSPDRRLPQTDYLITLTRSRAAAMEVWPTSIRDALPTLPVPLRAPDSDVALELQDAFASIYDEASYDLSVDYSKSAPPPALGSEELAWAASLLAERRARR